MKILHNQVDLPLVSIIIPAFNAAKFIELTLESVLHQTYQNIEVIVVDDGSQDATPEIVRQFTVRDQRVRLIQQTNAGVAAARNSAIYAAKGDFIAPIDADDIWYPDKIERQMQCMLSSDSQVGLVYTWASHIDEENAFTGGFNAGDRQGLVLTDLLYRDFIGNGSGLLFRRSCLEKIGGYNQSLRERGAQGCEDWDIALQIAEHYEFRVVPEILVGYRQTFGSMSRQNNTMEKSYNLTLEYFRSRHPEISETIFRWSKAEFYYYLAQGARQEGNQWRALRCLLTSVRLDPETILKRSRFYRIFVAILLSLPFQPFTAWLWSPRSWYKFRKKAPLRPSISSLEELNTKIKSEWIVWWGIYEKRLGSYQ